MTADHEQMVLEAAAAILRARGEHDRADVILGSDAGTSARGRKLTKPGPSASVLQTRLYERMVASNESQRGLGLRLGIGVDFIRCIMDGRTKEPSARKLIALADALGTSPHYLLGLRDEP